MEDMHMYLAKELEGHLDRYVNDEVFPCIFCAHETNDPLEIVTHLFEEHNFVIHKIASLSLLPKYLANWRMNVPPLVDVDVNGTRVKTIDSSAPEEMKIREILHKMRLDSVMAQFEYERTHVNEGLRCLFCTEKYTGTWHQYLQWLFEKHHFNPGRPSNLVYIEELVAWLRSQIQNTTCFHCGCKLATPKQLKQHMKKKPHDKIPLQKRFDRYYMVNYLEPGCKWQDVKDDVEDDTNQSIEEGIMDFGDDFEINETKCLICDHVATDPIECLQHMEHVHKFSLNDLRSSTGGDFYALVRFVNYAREMKQKQNCFVCEQLVVGDYASHIEWHGTKCPCNIVTDDKYLIPVIEGDALLTILENTE